MMTGNEWKNGLERIQPGIYADGAGALFIDDEEFLRAQGFAVNQHNLERLREAPGYRIVSLMAKTMKYPSVDAAAADLEGMLPDLKQLKQLFELNIDDRITFRRLYEKVCAAIELLENTALVRERLRKGQQPDGSIEFKFSPEAEAMLNQASFKKGC